MIVSRVPLAGTIFGKLLVGHRRTRQTRDGINVTFRESGGAVGRRDFATHWVHWYPAKMFHRIPSVFLQSLELPPGVIVLDPFCGSGTVPLEANLHGHNAIGIDINPLAQLISRVKTTPLAPDLLHAQCAEVVSAARRSRSTPLPEPILDSWLSPAARIGIHRLKLSISSISDLDCSSFFLVTLTSIIRRVSQADPSIPPLVRLREGRAKRGGARYRKALQKSQSITVSTVYDAFLEAATENIRRMSELHSLRGGLGHTAILGAGSDAASTGLCDESVDLIITSPPYCGSQKYVRSLKLELIVSGYPPDDLRGLDRQTLGTEAVTTRAAQLSGILLRDRYVDPTIRTIYERNPVRARMASEYSKYLQRFAQECLRVLRPGGHLLVTLGRSTLAGVPFEADQIFRRTSEAFGLQHIATLVDQIPSRGLLTQRHGTSGRIDNEFIVWLIRPTVP